MNTEVYIGLPAEVQNSSRNPEVCSCFVSWIRKINPHDLRDINTCLAADITFTWIKQKLPNGLHVKPVDYRITGCHIDKEYRLLMIDVTGHLYHELHSIRFNISSSETVNENTWNQ